MKIGQKIKLSFIIVVVLILFSSYFNSIISSQIEESNHSNEKIKSLVVIQSNMNELALDARYAVYKHDLEVIKKEFIKNEDKFERIKTFFLDTNKDDFIDFFIKDIQKYENISNQLSMLYKNEKNIEINFDELYELQFEKIKLNKLFKINYSQEKNIRNELEEVLYTSNNIDIIKLFSQMKYYGKEALYQKRTLKYLNKWLDSATILNEKINNYKLFDYISVIKVLKSNILKINKINKKEKQIVENIKLILNNTDEISQNIIIDTKIIFNNLIKKMNYILLFIIFITISLVILISSKVSKNIGLSVDEIEHKVEDGLKEIKKLNEEMENTQKEVVFTMGAIGESRSKETGNHVKRVAEYSKLLALKYGLSKKEAEMLKQASPMHDIGKVAIPDAVLNKPGRFDENERKIMDTHADLGYEMLKYSTRPLLNTAAIVAHEHHERYDGSGYPRGLIGEEIHIYGRITALADVFDALGSDRCYKKAWDEERIYKLLKEERGKHFDPKLIDIFFDNLDEFLKIRDKFKEIF